MYHQEQGAVLFKSAGEFAKAGSGWVDTPAKFTVTAQENIAHDAPATAPVVEVDTGSPKIGSPEELSYLREKARAAGIKGYGIMKRDALIKKLRG
jgi:lysozyme family protein